MRYLAISAYRRTSAMIECKTFDEAMRFAGLAAREVDFGRLGADLFIVVYEFGLDENHQPLMQYFGLAGNMYAGNALVYSVDASGATVDLKPEREWFEERLIWLGDSFMAEQAIQAGQVARPTISVNGETVWQWRHIGGRSHMGAQV